MSELSLGFTMRSVALTALFLMASGVGVSTPRTTRMESALSCVLATPEAKSAVRGIGLSLGSKASVRYYVGTIPGLEPTPGSYYIMVYSRDQSRAWILIADPAGKGHFVPGGGAFQMRRHGSMWEVEEGFGGLATYRAIGRFANWLSRSRREYQVVLRACRRGCSSRK